MFIFFPYKSFSTDWNRTLLCDDLFPHTEAQPCHLHLLTVIHSRHDKDDCEDDANADDNYDKRVTNPRISDFPLNTVKI